MASVIALQSARAGFPAGKLGGTAECCASPLCLICAGGGALFFCPGGCIRHWQPFLIEVKDKMKQALENIRQTAAELLAKADSEAALEELRVRSESRSTRL